MTPRRPRPSYLPYRPVPPVSVRPHRTPRNSRPAARPGAMEMSPEPGSSQNARRSSASVAWLVPGSTFSAHPNTTRTCGGHRRPVRRPAGGDHPGHPLLHVHLQLPHAPAVDHLVLRVSVSRVGDHGEAEARAPIHPRTHRRPLAGTPAAGVATNAQPASSPTCSGKPVAAQRRYRSPGSRPVRLAMRESIRGPSSSPSWNAKT